MWGKTEKTYVAAFVADLHIRHKKPRFRSAEKDWYEAQWRMLSGIVDVVRPYDVPLFIAGDIFHKADEHIEAVHFARRFLPEARAIYGNHDLPYHNPEMKKKSAYWMLVELGVIRDIEPGERHDEMCLGVTGFPFGTELKPLDIHHKCDYNAPICFLNVALVHDYIWTRKTGFQGAPEDKYFTRFRKQLDGFDVAVFGDNHHGFIKHGQLEIYNCGTTCIQKASEINTKPCVGLLDTDGNIKRLYLDTSKDKYIDFGEALTALRKEGNIDIDEAIDRIKKIGRKTVDFAEALRQYFLSNTVPKRVRNYIFEALGDQE